MPYEEWPEDVKQYYRYDPEAAEKLLDEAGYPRGADGVRFKTIYEHFEFFDLGYYQIAMDYLRQIGIDGSRIQIVNLADMVQKAQTQTMLGMRSDVWGMAHPSVMGSLASYWSLNGWRPQNVNDALLFDEYLRERSGRYYHRGAEGVDAEGRHAPHRAAVDHQGAHSSPVRCHPSRGSRATTGKTNSVGISAAPSSSNLWVDQDLKREMGF